MTKAKKIATVRQDSGRQTKFLKALKYGESFFFFTHMGFHVSLQNFKIFPNPLMKSLPPSDTERGAMD